MTQDAKASPVATVLGLLAIAVVALLATAGPALATPQKATVDPNPTGLFNTFEVSGTLDPGPFGTYYTFETSANGVDWSGFDYSGFVDGGTGLKPLPKRVVGGVVPGEKYFVRLHALDSEGGELISSAPYESFTTKPVPPPTVAFPQPTAVTGTSAHFSATIRPEADATKNSAFDVTWYLECTPECPEMPYIIMPASQAEEKVEVNAKDLLPGTKYEVKLITQNAGGTYTAGPKTFTTPVIAPSVRTSQAHVTTTTANLSGSINPNGAEASYHFEYGPGFASVTPTKTVFAGNLPVAVTVNLSGLTPDTTYPFRLVAENSAGEGKSTDKTFTTQAEVAESCPNSEFRVGPSAALPDCRAYELVNPPGGDWSDIVRVFPAADDGEHVSYLTLVPPEIANSAVVASSFLSTRTDSGWTTTDTNLRVKYVYGLAVSLPACFSSDYTHAIINGAAAISDDDQDGGANDLARVVVGNPIGEFLTFNEGVLPDKQGGSFEYLGGSSDLSKVVFFGRGALISSDAPSGQAIYMRDSTGLHVISRDTEGNVLGEATPVGSNCATRNNSGNNGVSADGTKVFFSSGNFGAGGAILRYDVDTGKTLAITRSQRAIDNGAIGSGGFSYASPDGNIVYFTSGDQLTDNATLGGGIYRYEVSTDTLEQLTPFLGNDYFFGFQGAAYGAENDSRIYFTTTHRLTPDAPRGGSSLYVWERGDEGGTPGPGGPSKGSTRLITSITDGGIQRVSQNGRYMLFVSRNSIDGAQNKNRSTIYLYDAVTRDIACVSCRPNGTPSGGDSNLADEPESLTTGIINPRNISNDGRVFFNSSDRLIPADQTFSQDVYEFYRGRVFLITAGQGDELQSYLADNSDDGKHVFFISRSPLRPEDRDSFELDLYDAHTDGGYPLPKPEPPICEGEACRTATSPKPEDAAPTTPNFSGAGNTRPKRVRPKHHHHKKKHHKKKHHRKRAGR